MKIRIIGKVEKGRKVGSETLQTPEAARPFGLVDEVASSKGPEAITPSQSLVVCSASRSKAGQAEAISHGAPN
jgi:hypothetical protein